MDETKHEMADLNDLLKAARRDRVDVPDGLTARILADAAGVQADFQNAVKPAVPRGRIWPQVRAVLGGWPGLGGMAATCALGLWIGISAPGFVPDPVGFVTAQSLDVDLFDSYDMAAALGED